MQQKENEDGPTRQQDLARDRSSSCTGPTVAMPGREPRRLGFRGRSPSATRLCLCLFRFNSVRRRDTASLNPIAMEEKVARQESSNVSVYDEVGPPTLLPRPEVDVVLTPSRDRPIAGELWSVAGEIYNRSTTTVWIVDGKTHLTLAPEMWGQTSQRGSIAGFFPTIRQRDTDEVVRIDPDGNMS